MEWWEVDQLYLMLGTAVKSHPSRLSTVYEVPSNFVGPLCPVPFHSVMSSFLKRAHASLHKASFSTSLYPSH